MAGDKHQPQQVVADRIVERGFDLRLEVGRYILQLRLEFPGDRVLLALVQRLATDAVDRAVFRRLGQPRRGVVRHAVGGPLFERSDQRVLREFLGEADVAYQPRQGGDDAR